MIDNAPFPDLYDWTWGEIVEYIECRSEARQQELRAEASIYFKTAGALAKMVMGGRGSQLSIMDTYDFLWSDEDRKQARANKRHRSLMNNAKPKPKPMTLEEQDAALTELKKKMQAGDN